MLFERHRLIYCPCSQLGQKSICEILNLLDVSKTACLKGSTYSEKIARGTLLMQELNALKIHSIYIYCPLGESSNRRVIISFPDIFSCPHVSSMSFTHFDKNGVIICRTLLNLILKGGKLAVIHPFDA